MSEQNLISTTNALGQEIALRPWEPSYWPIAWQWCQSYFWQVADDFSPNNLRDFVEIKMNFQDSAINLAVHRDGELGGLLILNPMSPLLCQGHCMFRKGISRLDSFWGRDTTVPALKLGMSLMWSWGYGKIGCQVFEDSTAMIALLESESIGAIREGVLVNHTRRQGQLVNMVSYALLKPEERVD